MVKPKTSLVLVTALLLLSSAALAQDFSTDDDIPDQPQSDLGEGLLAYNFVMRGLPASDGEEVNVERSFELEADEDESFSISQEEAVQTALDELGSSEWDLDEAEQSEGLYELEFVRGESEAEVSVDGSTGRIVEFEAEIEYEPLDESSAVLSGFIQFSNDRFELDTDIDINEEENEAYFEVEIEERDELGAEVVTRRSIREFEDAEPGQYTGVLEVTRDDEVVHTERQEFRVPGPVESDLDEETEDESEDLEELSREELIEEVRSLREQIQSLQNRMDSRTPETPEDRPEGIETPEDESSEEESEESEDEEESENETEESEQSGPPTEAPGNSENRPGFVNRMLSGIFG